MTLGNLIHLAHSHSITDLIMLLAEATTLSTLTQRTHIMEVWDRSMGTVNTSRLVQLQVNIRLPDILIQLVNTHTPSKPSHQVITLLLDQVQVE